VKVAPDAALFAAWNFATDLARSQSRKPHLRFIVSGVRRVNETLTKTHQIAILRQRRCPNPAERVPASAPTSETNKETDSQRMTTMAELTGSPGFAPRSGKTHARKRAAAIHLIATVGLAISLVIAATAVSLGNRLLTRGAFIDRGSMQAPVGALLDQMDAFGRADIWLSLKAQQ
jgi:hypothetical protein